MVGTVVRIVTELTVGAFGKLVIVCIEATLATVVRVVKIIKVVTVRLVTKNVGTVMTKCW